MSDFPITRRDLLQVTGAGGVGIAGLSQVGVAETSSGGDKIWEFETGDWVRSSPTVVDKTVFVGSRDGNVYALDAADGTEQWRFETGFIVQSSPTVVDGTVFVGSWDRNVYALDKGDGSEQWSFETGNSVRPSPTVVDGTVFVGSRDGNMYALDAADGSEQWRFETGAGNSIWGVESSSTVVDGTVFVGSWDGNVYALDTADGSEQWHFETNDRIWSSPTVVDETVFIGNKGNNIYALDAADGSEQWHFESGFNIRSVPTVIGSTVFVGSWDGNVYALNTADGSEQWRFKTGDITWSSPTVVDKTVFVGSQDNNVYALDAADGTEQWRFKTGDSGFGVSSSPTVVDGTVFVGSDDKNVYALDAGIKGSSEGSRVNLGTLGHHHVFAENGPTGPGIPDGSDLAPSFTFDPETPNIGETVTFDAGDSSPADAIQEYRWDFTGDGETDATGETVDRVFEDPEEQTVKLTVVDADGNETSTEKSLTVDPLPQIRISLTPQEIDFGVQSIASTPQRTLTLENTTDQAFTIDANTPASVRFSPDDDLFDIDLPFVGVEPPFSLDPGESQTAVLELDTSEAVQNSSMDGDAHLRQSISLSTESGEIAEVPTRVTIFNGEAVESLRNAADANSDLFDAEKIQKEGAYNNLSNMYKNLFEIVKELSTGPNYREAIKPLVDFASSVPQTAENNNIGEGIREAKFDQTPFEFSPEEFEDGYDEVSNDFDDVITGIENENRSEISNSYDDAEKRLKNLTYKWDESKGEFKNILRNTLTGEDALEKAEGLVVEYTKAIDGLFKLVQGTTPLYLTTASPVNIAATDPDGQKVGPDENEIPGSMYKEIDRGKDGTTEDLIYIQDKKPGEYRVNVSESDDGSGDSFSLVAVTDDESMVIADETPVSDIPDDGYKIETSEDPESDPVGARPEDYATEDGLVTVNGLREAIADWRSTDITDELLSQVTTVWIEHKEVD